MRVIIIITLRRANVSAMIDIQTISDKSSNIMQVILPHKVNHSTGHVLPTKQETYDRQIVRPDIQRPSAVHRQGSETGIMCKIGDYKERHAISLTSRGRP
jgi:hypothetical protein